MHKRNGSEGDCAKCHQRLTAEDMQEVGDRLTLVMESVPQYQSNAPAGKSQRYGYNRNT